MKLTDIKTKDQVWNQVSNQVGNQVDQVWNQVWFQVRDQVRGQIWNQVWNQVRDQVEKQIRPREVYMAPMDADEENLGLDSDDIFFGTEGGFIDDKLDDDEFLEEDEED